MNGELLTICTRKPITCPRCGNKFKDVPAEICFDSDYCEADTCEYGFLVWMECEAEADSGRIAKDTIKCRCGWKMDSSEVRSL